MANREEVVFYTVKDVMAIIGKCRSTAYQVIKEINKELEEQGFITFNGRVNKKAFHERIGG